jgi:hypothetical protein
MSRHMNGGINDSVFLDDMASTTFDRGYGKGVESQQKRIADLEAEVAVATASAREQFRIAGELQEENAKLTGENKRLEGNALYRHDNTKLIAENAKLRAMLKPHYSDWRIQEELENK